MKRISVYRWAVIDMPMFDCRFVCTVSENLFTGLSACSVMALVWSFPLISCVDRAFGGSRFGNV